MRSTSSVRGPMCRDSKLSWSSEESEAGSATRSTLSGSTASHGHGGGGVVVGTKCIGGDPDRLLRGRRRAPLHQLDVVEGVLQEQRLRGLERHHHGVDRIFVPARGGGGR